MITWRCKSTVCICLIRPAQACLLRRLAKWECRQIRFRTTRLVPLDRGYANDVPLPDELFSASYCFQVIDPKVHWSYWKLSFGEKRPFNGKIWKLRYESFHRHMDSGIPAKLIGNRQIVIYQTGAWYSSRKRLVLVFCPFLWDFWSDLAQNFTGSLFRHSHPFCQFLSKSVQFPRRYIRKCLSDSL